MDVASIATGALFGSVITWFVNHGLSEWRDKRKAKSAAAKTRRERFDKAALRAFKSLVELRSVCTAGDAHEDEELGQRFIDALEKYSISVAAVRQASEDLEQDRDETSGGAFDNLLAARQVVTLLTVAEFVTQARLPLERPLSFLDDAWNALEESSLRVRRHIDRMSLDKARD